MWSPHFTIFSEASSPNPNAANWCTSDVLMSKGRRHASNKITVFCTGATRWCMLYLEKLRFTPSG